MRKNQIRIGRTYTAKVSGTLTTVRIESVNLVGGWNATNLKTGRACYIRTAGRLRGEVIDAPKGN